MAAGVVKGIVLLEGSFPVDHLNPALKHLLHYGEQTGYTVILDWCSMFCFERKNKEVKKLTRNTAHPLSSLANHIELDIVVKLQSFSEKTPDDLRAQHISLTVSNKRHVLSEREKTGLTMLGVTSFSVQSIPSSQTSRSPFQWRGLGKEAVRVCGDYHLPSGFTMLCRQRVPGSGR